MSKSTRIQVSVDWAKVPTTPLGDKTDAEITIAQRNGAAIRVRVEAFSPNSPSGESASGFVEGDGYVAMEAEHYTRAVNAGEVHWDRIPGYGAALSGMTVFPVTAQSVASSQAERASLEYRYVPALIAGR